MVKARYFGRYSYYVVGSNLDSNYDPLKSLYRTLRWFQSRPQFYMAGVSQWFNEGVRMAEWLWPGTLGGSHVILWDRTWTQILTH